MSLGLMPYNLHILEDMPAGQTPHTVSLYAHGDLVDKVQPGDRVTITGIFRAIPMRYDGVRNLNLP